MGRLLSSKFVSNVGPATVTLNKEVSVDIYEWIDTKTYCPVDPMMITTEQLSIEVSSIGV
jgi:hypothetical protein